MVMRKIIAFVVFQGWCLALLVGCQHSHQQEPLTSLNTPENRLVAAEARLKLGLVYLREKDLEKARYNLLKAYRYAPEYYQTQLAMAVYEQTVGEYMAAQPYYEQAIKLAPKEGSVLNSYGAFLCQLRQYNKAQQQFDSVIRSHDALYSIDSMENSGFCYLKEGKFRKAEQQLKQVISKAPNRGDNLCLMAEYFLQNKEYSKARVLNELYQQTSPLTAASLWLQLRLAVSDGEKEKVKTYANLLANNFPKSEQYKRYLAHEY